MNQARSEGSRVDGRVRVERGGLHASLGIKAVFHVKVRGNRFRPRAPINRQILTEYRPRSREATVNGEDNGNKDIKGTTRSNLPQTIWLMNGASL